MLKEHFKRRQFQAASVTPDDPQRVYQCGSCSKIHYIDDVQSNDYTCPTCNHYFALSAKERLNMIIDRGSFREIADLATDFDPLNFPGYRAKKQQNRENTALAEAVVCGKAKINGEKIIIAVMDSHFLMGSMGVEVGEKITRAIELAAFLKHPLIIFSASGGARMQEGIYSLFQMSKTQAAMARFQAHGGLYISVLTNPTLGGVTASFAMSGDIILAEEGALVGFAGPRVIEQTIGQKLPEGFQKAAFLREHGIIDAVVPRQSLRQKISDLLTIFRDRVLWDEVAEEGAVSAPSAELNAVKKAAAATVTDDSAAAAVAASPPSAMDIVKRARDAGRPTSRDYIAAVCDEFHVLAGDRKSLDDEAIVAGLARINNLPLMVISQQKGRSLEENSRHNFGMVKPQGYRKALRLAELAAKFGLPVLTLVDTPGAYCGISAEEDGQGIAIAECLHRFSELKTASLALVIGEGGSGGALALSVTDEIWMMENAVYSILSPEGFASILWKDSGRAAEAAELMKLSARDLFEGGIVDKVLAEGEDFAAVYAQLKQEIPRFLATMHKLDSEKLVDRRYRKFRKAGL